MTPFTPDQQRALITAFNVVCRSHQVLKDQLAALDAFLIARGAVNRGWLDDILQAARDQRELARLVHPQAESVRQAVARILAGEIVEADRAPEVDR